MGILSFFRKILLTTSTMSDEDISVIQQFAEGDESQRENAIRVYRNNILTPGAKRLPCMQFMHEIDTPYPDPIQQSIMRKRVTKKAA